MSKSSASVSAAKLSDIRAALFGELDPRRFGKSAPMQANAANEADQFMKSGKRPNGVRKQ